MAIPLLCVLWEPNNTRQAKVDIYCSYVCCVVTTDIPLAVLTYGELYQMTAFWIHRDYMYIQTVSACTSTSLSL